MASSNIKTDGLYRPIVSIVARRLIVTMILFSSLITLIVTAYQLYRDYNRDILLIDSQLAQIEKVHLRNITRSLWVADERELQLLIEGIQRLPDMQYLEIREGDRIWATVGIRPSENTIERDYPLIYVNRDRAQNIGMLTVVATLDEVYQRLIDKVEVILVSNAIKTFLVAGFMLMVFHLAMIPLR